MILEGDGGTLSATSGDWMPDYGYYVGGSKPGAPFIGWWRDQETSLIHLDFVDWFSDLADAVSRGNGRGEIAIWDIANVKEIRL